jgi:hypothetical protein
MSSGNARWPCARWTGATSTCTSRSSADTSTRRCSRICAASQARARVSVARTPMNGPDNQSRNIFNSHSICSPLQASRVWAVRYHVFLETFEKCYSILISFTNRRPASLPHLRSELRGRPVSAARLQGVPGGHSRLSRAGGRRGTHSSVVHLTHHSECYKNHIPLPRVSGDIFNFVCKNKCEQCCSQPMGVYSALVSRILSHTRILTHLPTFGPHPHPRSRSSACARSPIC